jgi:gluconolactonase
MITRHIPVKGLIAFACSVATCLSSTTELAAEQLPRPIGTIERADAALNDLVPNDAQMEVICEGFSWCEGPAWIRVDSPSRRGGGFLLFSDIPNNAIMRWDKNSGCSLYLKPAGYTGQKPRGGESGSNGLTTDSQSRLILCQHGDRRVARMDSSTDDPRPRFVTLADSYDGKRLNSPNDAVVHSSGAIYFTDPPYGLEKNVDDPAKELPFQGVYRIAPDGNVTLLTKDMERPNGIAFSPDERTLYVANSHGPRMVVMAYPVDDDGALGAGRVFFDATQRSKSHEGACDGMVVDERGNVFATLPGGVGILSPQGKLLGTLLTGKRTSNCTFGEDGSTLFITADDTLLRVRLTTVGIGFN